MEENADNELLTRITSSTETSKSVKEEVMGFANNE